MTKKWWQKHSIMRTNWLKNFHEFLSVILKVTKKTLINNLTAKWGKTMYLTEEIVENKITSEFKKNFDIQEFESILWEKVNYIKSKGILPNLTIEKVFFTLIFMHNLTEKKKVSSILEVKQWPNKLYTKEFA